MFDRLAEMLGTPEGNIIFYKLYLDQVRIIMLIFAGLPIGYINHFIKCPTKRLWYGLITGVILQFLMYRFECIHILSASIITYLFITFFGRKLSAFYVLIFTVAHLSYLHIKRMISNPGGWELDASTIYMMSICKFSAIAFAYEDGAKSDEEIKNSYFKQK